MHRVTIGCLALCLLDAAAEAGSPVGLWETDGGRSQIRVESCGQLLCGKVVWLKEPNNSEGQPKRDRQNPEESLRERPLLGLPLMTGFKPASDTPDQWVDGQIYDPESGKTYSSQMTLQPDGKLEVRGYVGLPLFGRSTVWTPVK